MREKGQKQQDAVRLKPLALKCGAILLLFLLSALIVACGANATASAVDLGNPQVTVTIGLNMQQSPVPTAPPHSCGAWVTNTSPSYRPGNKIPVNMKFTHLVNGVPQGVGNASATATVTWADGQSNSTAARTTSDGLAVAYFTIPNDPTMMNKNNQVTVNFTAPDGTTCAVDGTQAAFFTFVQASPAAQGKATPTPRNKRGR